MIRRAAIALLFCASPALAESKDVHVESRAVEGSKVLELIVTGTIDAPPGRVIAMLTDVEAYPELMWPTIASKIIAREGDTQWCYMVIDPPLIERRDYCMKMTLTRFADGGFKSEWTDAPERCPPPMRGLLRIVRNVGSWELHPLGAGKTSVRYTQHSDPGGAVPTWIVNSMSVKAMPDIFNAVRRAVALPRYANRGGP
jgi:Polyketide cyclase / dehydrase and lipid transport